METSQTPVKNSKFTLTLRKRNSEDSKDPRFVSLSPPHRKRRIHNGEHSRTSNSPDTSLSQTSSSHTISSSSQEALKQQVVDLLGQRLCAERALYHRNVVELNYLQEGNYLCNFYSHLSENKSTVLQSLQKASLSKEDHRQIRLAEKWQSVASERGISDPYPPGFFPLKPFESKPSAKSSALALKLNKSKKTSYTERSEQTNIMNMNPRPDEDSEDSDISPQKKRVEQEIYDQALREAHVLQRISELRHQDLWSEDTLERLNEPLTSMLLYHNNCFSEMEWLSQDFARERRWKRHAAKKFAHAATKIIKEKEERKRRAEKEENLRVRKLAATVSKMVRDWWRQMNKVVKAKQDLRLSVKRQEAMSTHLGKVIETTEKFTEWLAEGMQTSPSKAQSELARDTRSNSRSSPASTPAKDLSFSPKKQSLGGIASTREKSKKGEDEKDSLSSDESAPDEIEDEESDVESTIAKEEAMEAEEGAALDRTEELNMLQNEGELPLDDLLDSLPPELLQELMSGTYSKKSGSGKTKDDETDDETSSEEDDDDEDDESDDDEEDVEQTIEEQETFEGKCSVEDYHDEVDALKAEAEMSLDELRADLAADKPSYPPDIQTNSSEGTVASLSTEDSTFNVHKQDKTNDEECSSSVLLLTETESTSLSTEDLKTNKTGENSASLVQTLVSSTEMECSSLAIRDSTKFQEEDQTHSSLLQTSADLTLASLPVEDSKIIPEEDQIIVKGTSFSVVHTVSTSEIESSSQADDVKEDVSFMPSEVREKDASSFSSEPAELSAISEAAISAMPRGFTLDSTQVRTTVPFLLRHELREYQWVGLDWMATMYEKRLNGILADEMGLGKTIQTISLLAHLACEKGVWGPHLIIVPTSVIINWEVEFKKWCPAFKILTYYGGLKERLEKRRGWTKSNAFHVCITSYKLAIQDAKAFKRKKWKYIILDEAQNIKNFRSQRWQTLLTFNSQRRLLLTGTPLQNSLMELWSLMHFLMSHLFQSHREFQEWFASPLTGMVEGNSDYNDQLVRRLHKVLRPFILRRLKKDVEKQMPKKYEHVVMCPLSRRQRFLYHDFLTMASTRESLASGSFMSVINVLMQLRKVCNHPNLFEPRPIVSPFAQQSEDALVYHVPKLVCQLMPLNMNETVMHSNIPTWWPNLCQMATDLPGFVARNVFHELQPRKGLIEEVDHFNVRTPLSKDKDLKECSIPLLSRQAIESLHNDCLRQSNRFNCEGNDSTKTKTILGASYPLLVSVNSESSTFEYTPPHALPLSPKPEDNLPTSIIDARRASRKSVLRDLEELNRLRILAVNLSSGVEDKPGDRVGFGSVCTLDQIYCARRLFLSGSANEDVFNGLQACIWSQAQRHQRLFVEGLRRDDWPDVNLRRQVRQPFVCSTALDNLVHRREENAAELKSLLNNFLFFVPTVICPSGIRLIASSPRHNNLLSHTLHRVTTFVNRHSSPLLSRANQLSQLCFPEPRLIEYDCGKLQTLHSLLRQLQQGKHRVLIFTQMARMLDILESFLCYHGYRYLRLDGATKIEQRQVYMERFNQDTRIFAFILSTRSGGLGINLTGADTVVFYDSDWNPTMDAQAQDRCHRIGQTRDVHIYRLISERTVEENILKKANQKRLLIDVAIEGGQFTTAVLKQNTLKDLLAEPSGVEELTSQPGEQSADLSEGTEIETETEVSSSSAATPFDAQLETMLDAAEEDERDRLATRCARAEAKADLAEFDENVPWAPDENNLPPDDVNAEQPIQQLEVLDVQSKAEQDLKNFEAHLKPIERFGINLVEGLWGDHLTGELEMADAQLEQSKQTWELDHIKALRERQDAEEEEEEDEMFIVSTTVSGNKKIGRPRKKLLPNGTPSTSVQYTKRVSFPNEDVQSLWNVTETEDFLNELNNLVEDTADADSQESTLEARQRWAAQAAQSVMQKLAEREKVAAASISRKRSSSNLKERDLDSTSPKKERSTASSRVDQQEDTELPFNPTESSPSNVDSENQMFISRPSPGMFYPQVSGSAVRFPPPKMVNNGSLDETIRSVVPSGPRPRSQKIPIPRLRPRLQRPNVGATFPTINQPPVAPRIVTPLRPVQFRVQYLAGSEPDSIGTASPSSTTVLSTPTATLLPPQMITSQQLLWNTQPVILITKHIQLPNGQSMEHRMSQSVTPPLHFVQLVQRTACPTQTMPGASLYPRMGLTYYNTNTNITNNNNTFGSSVTLLQRPTHIQPRNYP